MFALICALSSHLVGCVAERSVLMPDEFIIQFILSLVSIASLVPADGLAVPPLVKGGYEIIEQTLTVQCQM